MSIDIFFEEEKIGKLEMYTDGLYTVFTAELPLRPGLYRLWLIGEETYPLGILEPKGESLYLRRRLSRRQVPPFTHAQLLPATDPKPPLPKGGWREAPGGYEKWQPHPDHPKQPSTHFIYINGKKYTVFRY